MPNRISKHHVLAQLGSGNVRTGIPSHIGWSCTVLMFDYSVNHPIVIFNTILKETASKFAAQHQTLGSTAGTHKFQPDDKSPAT